MTKTKTQLKKEILRITANLINDATAQELEMLLKEAKKAEEAVN